MGVANLERKRIVQCVWSDMSIRNRPLKPPTLSSLSLWMTLSIILDREGLPERERERGRREGGGREGEGGREGGREGGGGRDGGREGEFIMMYMQGLSL